MKEISRVVVSAKSVRSLCWHADALIDWVNGGNQYSLDGTSQPSYVRWAYRFDRAVTSPDGCFAVIYEVQGTKGLVLKNGQFVREINRSFYQANAYEYPVVLFALPDGRNLLAHCPEEYNKIEIEDTETGERLTRRTGESADFFHSRLSTSPDGRYLMSAGWIWHPLDDVMIYEIGPVLAQPEILDQEQSWELSVQGVEINNAAFAAPGTVLFTGADAYYDAEDDEEKDSLKLRPDQIGHYHLDERRFLSIAPLSEPTGTLMPAGEFVVSFYDHPKLIHVGTGEVVARWRELETGHQNSSIVHHADKLPPLVLDAKNKRFAVADGEKITVIQLG